MSKRFILLFAASLILLIGAVLVHLGWAQTAHDYATAGIVLLWLGVAER